MQDKAIALKYEKRFARHEEFISRKQAQGLGASAIDLFDQEPPPDTPLLQPSDGAESATDSQHVAADWRETAEGVIREADCGQSPQVNVRFATAGAVLRLTVLDSQQIAYRVGGLDSTAAANECSVWKGRKAKVSYRPGSVDGMPAEIVSIEFE